MPTDIRAPRNKLNDMYPRYEAGEFGNKLVTWKSLAAFSADVEAGIWSRTAHVVLRYKGPPGVMPPNYGVGLAPNVAIEQARAWVDELGYTEKLIVVNELASDGRILFNAEVGYRDGLLCMTYSTVPKPMRPSLAEGAQYAYGPRASLLLLTLDEESRENLYKLILADEGSVVELSCYSMNVGNLGWNTVFWEWRMY